MASVPSSAPSIKDEDTNKFKVIHVLNKAGQLVLLTVYQKLKPFDDSKNIKEHLIQDLHKPLRSYTDEFDSTMRNVIETTDKSGKHYDISLLIKCIRVLSRHYEPRAQSKWNDEDQLECRCQKLANIRNKTYHSFSGISTPVMRTQIDTIEKVIMDILTSLEARFPSHSITFVDMKTDIHDEISTILTQRLGDKETRIYLLQKYMKLLRDEIPSLKKKCSEYGKLTILDFLLGSKKSHEIKLLFTEVIVEKSNRLNPNESVDCKDIFKMVGPDLILLIDAEAGGGKTTIFQYGINDWAIGGRDMNISEYDFLFPMEFRNPHICSVKELIEDLIPNASINFGVDGIMKSIENPSSKILFFCDGYDEKNEKSQKLFREISDLKRKFEHIKVIVTSRPEAVREFHYTEGRIHSIEHLKVLGIHKSKRGDFLKKYHDEMIAAGLSTQSTYDLIRYFNSISDRHQELYRLPINLVILAWIWGQDPEKAKTITTGAGLYSVIDDMLTRKLRSRILESHPDVIVTLKNDFDKLERLIDTFKAKICIESLNAVRDERIFIDDKGVKKLSEFCDNEKLPFLDLKGAFLLSKVEWKSVNDMVERLEFPHKGFLDFFSARCIESKLHKMAEESDRESITENSNRGNIIKEIISQIEGRHFTNFQKYQNILQLLGGILALNDVNLVDKYGKQIIDLLIETGISNNVQWYDVFSNFNLNPTAAGKFGKLIAPYLIFDNFTIKDADVEVLSTLLKYVDINKVDLQISNTTPFQLPELINVLRNKKCQITGISKITDELVDVWNSGNTSFAEIITNSVKITNDHGSLPFLSHIKTKNCNLQGLWRELYRAAPDMTK
ncbi:unnamed protein product [Meganyctiphanes norvegica]|uniref:NACHT domain-containing protein n=1 Tax=Meganyctiphanes norvegica TaxID=48144 RepID=A0AAV2Q1G1_MEGNR